MGEGTGRMNEKKSSGGKGRKLLTRNLWRGRLIISPKKRGKKRRKVREKDPVLNEKKHRKQYAK